MYNINEIYSEIMRREENLLVLYVIVMSSSKSTAD
jgi:hypothetical protein